MIRESSSILIVLLSDYAVVGQTQRLYLSVVALGVLLGQHIANFWCNFRAKGLRRPTGHEFVEPEQRIIMNAGQQSIAVFALLDPRTKLLKWKSLCDDQARREILSRAFRDDDVDDEPHAVRRYGGNLSIGIFERREVRHDRSCGVVPPSPAKRSSIITFEPAAAWAYGRSVEGHPAPLALLQLRIRFQ